MKIDERLLAYKPISVTLNFDWENTTYDERVQMRHDYIEEQKKKDPNYVGYDFPEWFRSSHGSNSDRSGNYFVDKNKLVNTIGQIVKLQGKDVIISFGSKRDDGYLAVRLSCNGGRGKAKVHRIVACTFIPIPFRLRECSKKIVVNHKNDVRHCNFISNLEWCTNQENVTKAYETGVSNVTPFKCVVGEINGIEGNVYYFSRISELNELKFSGWKIYNSVNTGSMYCHARWFQISKEELSGKKLGIPEEDLLKIRDTKNGNFKSRCAVGTIVSDGPCKGEVFYIFGSAELRKYGFDDSSVSSVILNKRKTHRGCTWYRISRKESLGKPIGLTEAQKEHIFGKKE